MATYSEFFSSGFLATHIQIPSFQSSQAQIQDSLLSPKEVNPSYFNFEFSSPARPSSLMAIADDSDIEVDDDERKARRSLTPTPIPTRSVPAPPTYFPSTSPQLSTSPPLSISPTDTRPKLRKRRSSLTIATSALSAIRSPARTAQSAAASNAVLRARSGSVGTAAAAPATEKTSLVGRMRSGSVGVVNAFRLKRPNRRNASTPAAPPPTAPLPAIPQFLTSPVVTTEPRSAPLNGTFNLNVNVAQGARAVYEKKGRARAMSGVGWIEGIKEN